MTQILPHKRMSPTTPRRRGAHPLQHSWSRLYVDRRSCLVGAWKNPSLVLVVNSFLGAPDWDALLEPTSSNALEPIEPRGFGAKRDKCENVRRDKGLVTSHRIHSMLT